jgi:hypothetical protein
MIHLDVEVSKNVRINLSCSRKFTMGIKGGMLGISKEF